MFACVLQMSMVACVCVRREIGRHCPIIIKMLRGHGTQTGNRGKRVYGVKTRPDETRRNGPLHLKGECKITGRAR
jgi:hypothetical protein